MGQAQTSTDVSATEKLIYEKFRDWVTRQPSDVQRGDPFGAYREILAADGLGAVEIDRQITLIATSSMLAGIT